MRIANSLGIMKKQFRRVFSVKSNYSASFNMGIKLKQTWTISSRNHDVQQEEFLITAEYQTFISKRKIIPLKSQSVRSTASMQYHAHITISCLMTISTFLIFSTNIESAGMLRTDEPSYVTGIMNAEWLLGYWDEVMQQLPMLPLQ